MKWNVLSEIKVRNKLVNKGQYTYDVHENCQIFRTPHPSIHLCSKFFHPLDLKRPILNEPALPTTTTTTISNKLWNNNRTVHINERNQSKKNQVTSHLNLSRVLLIDWAHKQYNGIIKGWLHCLTPEASIKY